MAGSLAIFTLLGFVLVVFQGLSWLHIHDINLSVASSHFLGGRELASINSAIVAVGGAALSPEFMDVPPASLCLHQQQQQQQQQPKDVKHDHKDNEEKDEAPEVLTLDHNKNRTIALVHVGKAGGSTMRHATTIRCKVQVKDGIVNTPEKQVQYDNCVKEKFGHLDRRSLALSTRHYFHVHDYNYEDIKSSTSFLITIRNPIDRIISSYRYSHPGNCNNKTRTFKIRGCLNYDHIHDILNSTSTSSTSNNNNNNSTTTAISFPTSSSSTTVAPILHNHNSTIYRLFHKCFPSPGMQDFAASVLGPYDANKHFQAQNFTKQQKLQCRLLARQVVTGQLKTAPFDRPAPHFQFHYEYYAEKTLWKFPKKEVFVIRTEHEWDDIRALDQLLLTGSTVGSESTSAADTATTAVAASNSTKAPTNIKHGSSGYYPSPLTDAAYQKLCCVLEQELEVYKDMITNALNLDAATKHDTIQVVQDKCGISKWPSWTSWRANCRNQMDADNKFLARYVDFTF